VASDPAPEKQSSYPKFTRPTAIGIVLALVVIGGMLGVSLVSARADVPLETIVAPLIAGLVLGVPSGVAAYTWAKRRLDRGRRMPTATWLTAALCAGVAALLLQTPGGVMAALLGFCLGLPATIIFLVHVWPRGVDPYS